MLFPKLIRNLITVKFLTVHLFIAI